MGEFGYMDDAIDDIESGVFTFYLYMSNESDSLQKRVADISKYFPTLTTQEIEKIIIESTNENVENKELSDIEYLNSLSTRELDGIYSVLVRNLGNNEKTKIINDIEKIVINRTNQDE
jgi:hypothetical protein